MGCLSPSGCTLDGASRSRQAEDQKATLVMPDECKNALKRSVDGMAVRFPVGPASISFVMVGTLGFDQSASRSTFRLTLRIWPVIAGNLSLAFQAIGMLLRSGRTPRTLAKVSPSDCCDVITAALHLHELMHSVGRS